VKLYLHSPIRLHGLVLVKHRDNFIFYLHLYNSVITKVTYRHHTADRYYTTGLLALRTDWLFLHLNIPFHLTKLCSVIFE